MREQRARLTRPAAGARLRGRRLVRKQVRQTRQLRGGVFTDRRDRVLGGLAGVLLAGGVGAVLVLGGRQPAATGALSPAPSPTTVVSPSPIVTTAPSPHPTKSPDPKPTKKPKLLSFLNLHG